MFDRILLATDGSDSASHAFDYALDLVRDWGSELYVVSVVPPVCYFSAPLETQSVNYPVWEEELSNVHDQILNEIEEKLKEYPEIRYHLILEHGKPCKKISEVASKEDVDLIILGSRGIGGISGFIFGSTSHSTLDSCDKPLLVIK